jgi:hypothetical protein
MLVKNVAVLEMLVLLASWQNPGLHGWQKLSAVLSCRIRASRWSGQAQAVACIFCWC